MDEFWDEHISNPKEFQEGKDDYANGMGLGDCPYNWGTAEYHAWEQGWQEALAKDNE